MQFGHRAQLIQEKNLGRIHFLLGSSRYQCTITQRLDTSANDDTLFFLLIVMSPTPTNQSEPHHTDVACQSNHHAPRPVPRR